MQARQQVELPPSPLSKPTTTRQPVVAGLGSSLQHPHDATAGVLVQF